MELFNTAGVFSKDIFVWVGDGNLLKVYCNLEKTAFNSRSTAQQLGYTTNVQDRLSWP